MKAFSCPNLGYKVWVVSKTIIVAEKRFFWRVCGLSLGERLISLVSRLGGCPSAITTLTISKGANSGDSASD